MVQYGQQRIFVTPDDTQDTWNCAFYFISDPTMFGLVYTTNASGSVSAYFPVFNTALSGVGTTEAAAAWIAGFEQWRSCYAGVTTYLNAPALANQGQVAAAQYPCRHRDLGMISGTTMVAGDQLDRRLSLYPCVDFPTAVMPTYGSLVRMPQSYTGHAKDGCYMPLKLDSNHNVWHTASDYVYDLTGMGQASTYYNTPSGTSNCNGLYCDCQRAGFTDAGVGLGEPHLLPCLQNMGCVYYTGISKDATITIQLRLGFEARCWPESAFASYLKLPPAFDPVALRSYFLIARELKDAYPASYNDLGKLWEVIKTVGSNILGFLPPQIQIPIRAGLGAASLLTKVISKKKKQKMRAAAAAPVAQPAKVVELVQVAPTPKKRLAVKYGYSGGKYAVLRQ